MQDSNLQQRTAEIHTRAVIVDALGWSFIERPTAIVEGKDQVDKTVEAGITVSSQYVFSLA